jgi:hypothetical protein
MGPPEEEKAEIMSNIDRVRKEVSGQFHPGGRSTGVRDKRGDLRADRPARAVRPRPRPCCRGAFRAQLVFSGGIDVRRFGVRWNRATTRGFSYLPGLGGNEGVVDQNSASWNPPIRGLRQIERLRAAA